MKQLSNYQINYTLSNLMIHEVFNTDLCKTISGINNTTFYNFKENITTISFMTKLINFLLKNKLINKNKAYNIIYYLFKHSNDSITPYFCYLETLSDDLHLYMLNILPFNVTDVHIDNHYDFWILYIEFGIDFLLSSPLYLDYILYNLDEVEPDDQEEATIYFNNIQVDTINDFLDNIMPQTYYYLYCTSVSSPIIDELIDRNIDNKQLIFSLIKACITSNVHYDLTNMNMKIVSRSSQLHQDKKCKYTIVATYSYSVSLSSEENEHNIMQNIEKIINILDTLVLPELNK